MTVALLRSACTLGLLLCCAMASALTREGSVGDFRHAVWDAKTGAPSGHAMAQSSDGDLWLGSPDGLFRFDGQRFERFELRRQASSSSRYVFQLFAPATGGLWIGFAFGGVAFLKDGVFTDYSEADGVPPGLVMTFAQEADGTVWVGTTAGLARRQGGRWQTIGAGWHFPVAATHALMVDSRGTLWAGTDGHLFTRRRGETTFAPVPVQAQDNFSFAESADGAVWVWDDAGLRQVAQNENPARRTASSGRNLAFDHDGGLWVKGDAAEVRRLARPEAVAAGNAIAYDDVADVYASRQGLLTGEGPATIVEDREGNVWLFGHLGLERFSERRLHVLASEPRSGAAPLVAVNAGLAAAGDDGAVWITQRAPGSALRRWQGGTLTEFAAVVAVSCSLQAANGVAWFGGGGALWRYASGRFERWPVPPGLETAEVQAMAEEATGALWVYFEQGRGTYRFADGAWTAAPGGIGSLDGTFAETLATDARGRVWSGYGDGRIAVLDGRDARVFTAKDGPGVGTVTAIHGRRRHVWVGGDLGLARLEGERFRPLVAAAGHDLSGVTGIVETAAGDVWVNGAAGVGHIAAAEIRQADADPTYRVRVEAIDVLDGLEGTSARIRPAPTLIEAGDGRLWLATSAGIYWIDPAGIVRNAVPPAVRIRSVTADDASYAVVDDIVLPQRTKSLQIDYAGLSLTMPERVRYRYRLEGFEPSWQEAQGRRQAFYTNLAPGTYRFHVVAMNNDGVWSDKGASVAVTIPPAFVQTGWFILLCVVAGGVGAAALVRLRLRQTAARDRARFEARLAERERIARELHDTLLQSTQGLILGFQAVADRLGADDPHRALLDKSLANADEVLTEGRERVMDLRVPAESIQPLHEAIAAAGRDLAQGRAEPCRVEIEGAVRRLVPHAREAAYRIGREALINAFAHAGAGLIEVRIHYGDDALRLHVRDDGVGLDTGTLAAGARPGHWGLKGMVERARDIGGRLDIRSGAGGTDIELVVPAASAYERSSPGSRWRWLRRAGAR